MKRKPVNRAPSPLRRLELRIRRVAFHKLVDLLPVLLSLCLALVGVAAPLRIYCIGRDALALASPTELAQMTEAADLNSPAPSAPDQSALDALGHDHGYDLTTSKVFSFGSITTADHRVLYTVGTNQLLDKCDPFYNLMKWDEQDSNRSRMIPTTFGSRLLKGYNPLTGLRGCKDNDVILSLNSRVQSEVFQLLLDNGADGLCLAVRPDSGEVVCAASCHAVRDLYRINETLNTARPASTFKILLATLLEEQGMALEDRRFDCAGELKLADGSVLRCPGGVSHGTDMDLAEVLGKSCNCALATLLTDPACDWSALRSGLQRMGFRVDGVMPDPALDCDHLDLLSRDPSSTLLTGVPFSDLWSMLGQGKTSVSPVDMVRWCCAVVNGGRAHDLTLEQGRKTPTRTFFRQEAAQQVLSLWTEGYERCYDHSVYSPRITTAKTGTDQLDTHGTEAYTLMGWSQEADLVFYIRISNAVTEEGRLAIKPVDVANTLLEAVCADPVS